MSKEHREAIARAQRKRWRLFRNMRRGKHVAVKHGVSPMITLVDEIPLSLIDNLNALKKGQKVVIDNKAAGFNNINNLRMFIEVRIRNKILKGEVCERQKRIYFEKK